MSEYRHVSCTLIFALLLQASSRPFIVGPSVVTSPARRHLAAAPQAVPESLESADEDLEELSGAQEDLLQVEAAAVADESLKISNCNLSPSTVQVRVVLQLEC